jgi:hypothetical protein
VHADAVLRGAGVLQNVLALPFYAADGHAAVGAESAAHLQTSGGGGARANLQSVHAASAGSLSTPGEASLAPGLPPPTSAAHHCCVEPDAGASIDSGIDVRQDPPPRDLGVAEDADANAGKHPVATKVCRTCKCDLSMACVTLH